MDNNLNNNSNNEMIVQTRKKSFVGFFVLGVVLIVAITFIVLLPINDESNTQSDSTTTTTTTTKKDNNDNKINVELTWNQFYYKGKIFTVRETPSMFDSLNFQWKDDKEYLLTPTGVNDVLLYDDNIKVSLNIANLTKNPLERKHCTIREMIIYNNKEEGTPSDIVFYGGLNFDSSIEDVKSTMEALGYSNHEYEEDGDSYYLYFMSETDWKTNDADIVYKFYNNKLHYVVINDC